MLLLMATLMDGIPHGYCLFWNRHLLLLHAGSDSIIALAYFLIPLSLIRFIRQRRDLPFNWMFACFGAFILLCGTTHVLGVYNIWVPDWWLSGYVKGATAIVSVVTAVLLVKLLPQAIALPSPAQLNIANEQLATANELLRAEAVDRTAAQAALARAREDAEELVRVRTAELARANAELEHSEARYRALVQSSADIVWTANADGTPGDMSEWEEFTGAQRRDVMERREQFVHPDDVERVLTRWRQSVETVSRFASEHRLMGADGNWHHVRAEAVPVMDASGQVREWVGTHVDVTQQVEATRQLEAMQAQLQQSQRMEAVGRLAGGIAHDFNNLLTVITGAGTMVLDDMPRDHEWRRDVEDVVAAGTRASALTAQLLAYSRKQVLQPHRLDIAQVLADVHPMLRRLIGEHIAIDVVTHTRDWTVQADPNQLEQVILNLALNARDAMPDGGTITFETQEVAVTAEYSAKHIGVTPGQYVMLVVSDTGHGMDEATRAQIFEPFFTTKSVGAGTGLGLATVYGIVRQSGGHIYVYSEPGLGSTFKIYLPRADGPADTLDDVRDARHADGGTGETILLVEDAQDVRDFVARVLRRSGYVVHVADGPQSALEVLDAHGNDVQLLLSDVIMPGMNGRELADLVVQRHPGIAVLFMSGYTDNAIVHHGVLNPRTNFLHKPFTPDQLLNEIRRTLQVHSKRRVG
ncbi:MAG TPA: ATP-binding protein [Gemmatimonadaceae bacterium]|nr:ATP-binding protein [Gemmatimonadaceae bacterium]